MLCAESNGVHQNMKAMPGRHRPIDSKGRTVTHTVSPWCLERERFFGRFFERFFERTTVLCSSRLIRNRIIAGGQARARRKWRPLRLLLALPCRSWCVRRTRVVTAHLALPFQSQHADAILILGQDDHFSTGSAEKPDDKADNKAQATSSGGNATKPSGGNR